MSNKTQSKNITYVTLVIRMLYLLKLTVIHSSMYVLTSDASLTPMLAISPSVRSSFALEHMKRVCGYKKLRLFLIEWRSMEFP
jgi:hypothetical protein